MSTTRDLAKEGIAVAQIASILGRRGAVVLSAIAMWNPELRKEVWDLHMRNEMGAVGAVKIMGGPPNTVEVHGGNTAPFYHAEWYKWAEDYDIVICSCFEAKSGVLEALRGEMECVS